MLPRAISFACAWLTRIGGLLSGGNTLANHPSTWPVRVLTATFAQPAGSLTLPFAGWATCLQNSK